MARLLSTWFVYLVVYVPVLAAPVALMGTPHRNWRGFDTLMFITGTALSQAPVAERPIVLPPKWPKEHRACPNCCVTLLIA